ncbi:hypothetical protein AAV35_001990 [Salimicrobium jeotgali]|uniref:Uncharacterized protein n=1 Tax=Salimicrobium jeotgali TaxID=1230341 RepID=A0AAC8PQ82_9BACI|nr:hypothetical protein AAV35_001990 [Salimicrobium jeotgali]
MNVTIQAKTLPSEASSAPEGNEKSSPLSSHRSGNLWKVTHKKRLTSVSQAVEKVSAAFIFSVFLIDHRVNLL